MSVVLLLLVLGFAAFLLVGRLAHVFGAGRSDPGGWREVVPPSRRPGLEGHDAPR
jgi:hypothetical protein